MINKNEIQELEKSGQLKSPVVSLYLNTDLKLPEGEHYESELRRLISEAEKKLKLRFPKTNSKELIEKTVPKFLDFLKNEVEVQHQIRSVAFFASKNKVFAYTLPQGLRSRVEAESRPYIRPLLFLLDQYQEYLVIAADRHFGRILKVGLGEIEQKMEFSTEPYLDNKGSSSQKRISNRNYNLLEKHLKPLIKEGVKIVRKENIKRIILGGDEEIIHHLKVKLPGDFDDYIAGEFPFDIDESFESILEKTSAIAEQKESEEEKEAVESLKENLGNKKAVAGLASTLDALSRRKVMKLILMKGFKASGYACENCGYLGVAPKCPNCSSLTRNIEDLVELAIEKADRDKAEIEFVMENLDLEALGNIGAILRY